MNNAQKAAGILTETPWKFRGGRTVKCRYCDWQRPLWFKGQTGAYSGFTVLQKHIHDEHPVEYAAIQEYLGHEDY